MSTYRLEKLFAPRSVALVGGSPRERSLGGIVLRQLRAAGFPGALHVVNPNYPEIGGLSTVGDLNLLPEPPDVVVVTAPAPTVPGILGAAGVKGAAVAVVISAGLGHGSGSLAEQAHAAARQHGLRVV